MHDSPDFDPTIAFELTFADIGPQLQFSGEKRFFFERHLRYAESIPGVLVDVAKRRFEEVEPGKRPTFPFMSFGLIDSTMFNCFARKEAAFDRYHAGMSVSVPLAVLEMACHYFSFRELFPEIGDPQQGPMVQLDASVHPPLFQILDGKASLRFSKDMDARKIEHIHSSLRQTMDHATALQAREPNGRGTEFFRYFDTLLEFMLPACPVRRMHCEYMANALVHFLWIHEIAHITNGHLIELRERTGHRHSNFHEFYLGQFEGSSLGESIDCLAMEFDADIEAAQIMLGLIMSDIDIESDDAPYVSRDARVHIFVFALVAFYTAAAARELATRRLGTHPPAMLRLENIIVHLLGMVEKEGQLQKSILAGYFHFQSYCENLKHGWIPPAIDSEAHESFGKGKWWEIYQHRNAISTGYDKHRLGNLRIFMMSIADDWRDSRFFKLGPEPDWWE